jgi:hypothetical protein
MTCFNCGEVGHLTNRCPKVEEIRIFKASQLTRLQLKTQRARSAIIVGRRVTLLFNAQPTCSPSSDTVIYFSTNAQTASQREGGIASESLKDLKMQAVIESLR